MIVIAEPYSRFRRTIPLDELKSRAGDLLTYSENEIRAYYRSGHPNLEIYVSLRVEQGSTRVWLVVGTVVGALTLYGDIRQSVDYLIKDARSVGELILPEVPTKLKLPETPEVTQKRLGLPGKLERLFQAVEHHEITPHKATQLAL